MPIPIYTFIITYYFQVLDQIDFGELSGEPEKAEDRDRKRYR